jgi:hypothetical protein
MISSVVSEQERLSGKAFPRGPESIAVIPCRPISAYARTLGPQRAHALSAAITAEALRSAATMGTVRRPVVRFGSRADTVWHLPPIARFLGYACLPRRL